MLAMCITTTAKTITKGKEYKIKDADTDNNKILIENDSGKKQWYSATNFRVTREFDEIEELQEESTGLNLSVCRMIFREGHYTYSPSTR